MYKKILLVMYIMFCLIIFYLKIYLLLIWILVYILQSNNWCLIVLIMSIKYIFSFMNKIKKNIINITSIKNIMNI